MADNVLKVIDDHPVIGQRISKIIRDIDGIYIMLGNGMVMLLPDTNLWVGDNCKQVSNLDWGDRVV